MGDFNDDPINSSFKKVLKTKGKKEAVNENDLYNPFEKMFKNGHYSIKFRDRISLFDQIVVTGAFLDRGEGDFSTYKMFQPAVFNKRFLTTPKGRYKGAPFRSFSFGMYTGGYSDHYPVYMHLIREN